MEARSARCRRRAGGGGLPCSAVLDPTGQVLPEHKFVAPEVHMRLWTWVPLRLANTGLDIQVLIMPRSRLLLERKGGGACPCTAPRGPPGEQAWCARGGRPWRDRLTGWLPWTS